MAHIHRAGGRPKARAIRAEVPQPFRPYSRRSRQHRGGDPNRPHHRARIAATADRSTLAEARANGNGRRMMEPRLRVHELESTAIARAAYDVDSTTLDLWYKGGDRYRYFEVPEPVFDALLGAASAGEFVNREIKPRFRYEIEKRRRRFRPG
jgi:hypothetical protein